MSTEACCVKSSALSSMPGEVVGMLPRRAARRPRGRSPALRAARGLERTLSRPYGRVGGRSGRSSAARQQAEGVRKLRETWQPSAAAAAPWVTCGALAGPARAPPGPRATCNARGPWRAKSSPGRAHSSPAGAGGNLKCHLPLVAIQLAPQRRWLARARVWPKAVAHRTAWAAQPPRSATPAARGSSLAARGQQASPRN